MPRKSTKVNAEGKLRAKKVDPKHNGNINLKNLIKRDNGKLPLRINKSLVILVAPVKCNEQFAAEFRARMEKSNN